MDTVPSLLIDMRNWPALKDQLIAEIAANGIIGFDLETEDSRRHAGLAKFMSGPSKKLVFDVRRTTICGFSWWCDGAPQAYYLNLAHADIENRIPWSEAKQLLEAKPEAGKWICHNMPFEKTMMSTSLGYDIGDGICTLQMAVSCFGEDQYPKDKMLGAGFGGMNTLMLPIARAFGQTYAELTKEQEELLQQVIGKASVAQHSYNGFVKDISFGYGLKKLTKSLFGYDQTTFAEVMAGRAHMGLLTGDEVAAYGADDAVWAVRIFHNLLPRMIAQNDKLLDTFLSQENPMVEVFSDIWKTGLRIDTAAVLRAQDRERSNYATALRELQAIVRTRLPFPSAFNEGLLEFDGWYQKNSTGYREKITKWAMKDLDDDDFKVVHTTTGPVSDAWAIEKGKPRSTGPNLAYFMSVRTLMYDLTQGVPIIHQGKVTSDAEARLKMRGQGFDDLLDQMNKLAGIETRMKLYINPYLMLIDPETSRVYPIVNSMLNSRRMAMSLPNSMQLAKRGDGAYIRSFYLPDEDDEVIISLDWSQVELVEIGDFSGDVAFADAYGQLPYKDLHIRAAASVLGVTVPEFKALPNAKDLRTKIGKGANFNFWFSGALNTVGEKMGWTADEMWEKSDIYRNEFPVAEKWRKDLISEARDKGYVTLPDGHRRVKWEATYEWQSLWRERWDMTHNNGLSNFGVHFVKKITNRAGNQIVNSVIQGSCATIAKRSILAIRRWIKETGLRARFMLPIHDELVFSVHKDDAIQFIAGARRIMCAHPEIIKTLVLDCTASVGRTFEPFDKVKAPIGQIELDEAPEILGFVKDSKLGDDEVARVIEYLFEERKAA